MPDSEAQMHGQEPELDLLAALVPQLRERSMVDVGAEHGAVAAALRAAGVGPVWMVEPFPGNASRLRERFASEPDLHVLEVAAGARDGSAELHLAVGPSGEQMDAFHSLRPEPPRRRPALGGIRPGARHARWTRCWRPERSRATWGC